MATTNTYSPDQVAFLVGGASIDGWLEISIEFDEDDFGANVGNNGDVARVASVNNLGTMTAKLQQTSASNLTLSTLRIAKGIIPINLVDTSGLSVFSILKGWIVKGPPVTFGTGTDVGEVEWVFKGAMDVAIYGGNAPIL